MRRFSAHNRGARGATMVEATLALTFFLLFLISLIDLSRLAMVTIMLEHTMNTAARWNSIGSTLTDPDTGAALNRVQSLQLMIKNTGDDYGLDIDSSEMVFCRLSSPGCTTNSVGNSHESFIIKITKTIPCFMSTIDFKISRSIIGRNEPF